MGNIKNLNTYFYEMERITLDSGRIIYMTHLNQSRTYGDLLEGMPCYRGRPAEEPRVCGVEENERLVLIDNSPIPLPITEENKEELLKYSCHRRSPYPLHSLAPITCWANFQSNDPIPGTEEDDCDCFSVLTMEWFQEQYALPIDPIILEKIKALDWDAFAVNTGF